MCHFSYYRASQNIINLQIAQRQIQAFEKTKTFLLIKQIFHKISVVIEQKQMKIWTKTYDFFMTIVQVKMS